MPLCSPSMPGKPSLLDRALHDIEDNLSICYCAHLSCSQLFSMLDEGGVQLWKECVHPLGCKVHDQSFKWDVKSRFKYRKTKDIETFSHGNKR